MSTRPFTPHTICTRPSLPPFLTLIVALVGCVTLFGSCGQKAPVLTPIKEITFKAASDAKISALFNHVTMLQLETNDECIIPGIQKVEDVADTLVVLSNAGEVFTFERNTGKYIGKIADKGEGPEEYTEATDIVIAPKNHIGIVDRLTRSVKLFTLKGAYKGKRNIHGETEWMRQAELTDDGKLLYSNDLTGGYPPQRHAYTIASLEGRGQAHAFDAFAPVTVGHYTTAFASRPITKCDKEVSFLKFLNDTLFCYHDGVVTPRCRLATPQPMPSKKTMAMQGEYDLKQMVALNHNGNFFIGFDRLYETTGLLLLVTNIPEDDGMYWVDKHTGKGFVNLGTSEVDVIMNRLVTGYAVYHPVGSSDDELITSIDAEPAMQCFKRAASECKGKPVSDKARSFAKGINTEGNPCIIIYSHQ